MNQAKNTVNTQKALVVGGGNMASPIIAKLSEEKIQVTLVTPRPNPKFADLKSVTIYTAPEQISQDEVFDSLWICVKPQKFLEIFNEGIYKNRLGSNGVVISIVAGLALDTIEKVFAKNTAIVRAMPNIGALHGFSMTGAIANKHVTKLQHQYAEKIMRLIGSVLWISNEDDMNKITAISGSGPAYVFEIMRVFFEAAQRLGFAKDQAQQLVLNTIKGSLEYALNSSLSFEQMREIVRSPEGTTNAALTEMMKPLKDLIQTEDFQKNKSKETALEIIFNKSTNAAYQRGKELAEIAKISKK